MPSKKSNLTLSADMFNQSSPVLYGTGETATNTYQWINPEDEAVPAGDMLVCAAQLEDMVQQQNKSDGKIGLVLTAEDDLTELDIPLSQLALIILYIDKFVDGRSYSQAVMLRRQGYTGEIRAVGDVFQDMLFYLIRCGVDSFVLADPTQIAAAAAGLRPFSVAYQQSIQDAQAHYQTGSAVN